MVELGAFWAQGYSMEKQKINEMVLDILSQVVYG